MELQAQNYTFRNVVMSDGLSGLLVNAIYKDSEGFVWLGTDNCLDRFDGVKVRHFEFRGIESGRKKRVNTITETANKQLWVGNGIGPVSYTHLDVYKRETMVMVNLSKLR